MAFLLGGSKYYDSLRIKLSNACMMRQEDKYPRSVTYAYNLMLRYKDYTGKTQQIRTVSADTTQTLFNQHEEGGNGSERSWRELKDVLCYRCNRYDHYADQCPLSDYEA